jgi:hypothetical protein
MPAELTPAMRKAAEAVRAPITINEPSYLEQLWAALYATAGEEQGVKPIIQDVARSGGDVARATRDAAAEGLSQRG